MGFNVVLRKRSGEGVLTWFYIREVGRGFNVVLHKRSGEGF